jgi:uncharacterized protein (DUF302 family)
MYYVIQSEKGFEEVSSALESEASNYGFGVLYIHDMGQTFKNKNIDFGESCRIFEVCNPQKASQVMSIEMELNTALPCRVSVYTEKGITKIGLIKPTELLSTLSNSSELQEIANDVEEKLIKMMHAIK